MDKDTFKNLLDDAGAHLRASRLLPALTSMETLAGLLGNWDTGARLAETRRAYDALLAYYRSGAADDGRDAMYASFLARADEAYCALLRLYLTAHTDTAYALTERLHRNLPQRPSVTAVLDAPTLQLQTLFETVWLNPALTDAENARLRAALADGGDTPARQQLIVSALTLACLEVFDAQKLLLLVEASRHPHNDVRARAMAGTAFVCTVHEGRVARHPEVAAAIAVHCDTPAARRELAELQMQLFISLETSRVARSLREEILPEVLKDAKGKVRDADDLSRLNAEMAELGLNPEWEKDARRSEVGKKIRRLIEMQQKGADVYLSSFAMLKGRFPFFRTAANWFLPFDARLPELHLEGDRLKFAERITGFGLFCDSDKYSLALVLGSMSQQQFNAMAAQVTAMLPDDSEIDLPEANFTLALRSALQDFYRFATLFPHGDKRLSPFRLKPLLTDLAPFAPLVGQGETLTQIATFAFEEQQYATALPLILRQLEREPSARLWQMAGYCHQRAGAWAEAVEAYDRAGLFGEHSAWTVRQLAACNRAAGRYAEALVYYEQMAQEKPDDIPLLCRRADCLARTGRTDEALQLLHKADYLEEQPGEGTRALLHTLLHAGRYAQAAQAGQRLLADRPTTADRLLTAHATWLGGDTAAAASHYHAVYALLPPEERAARQTAELLFADEKDFLLTCGKTQVDLQIMADAVEEMQP